MYKGCLRYLSCFLLSVLSAAGTPAVLRAQEVETFDLPGFGQFNSLVPACRLEPEGRPCAGILRKGRFLKIRTLKDRLKKLPDGKWNRQAKRLVATRSGKQAVKELREQCRARSASMRGIANAPGSNPSPAATPTGPQAPDVTPTPSVQPSPSPSTPTPQLPSVPELDNWEAQMVRYGAQHCETLKGPDGFDVKLNATYYDAEWIYYQIADYTGDSRWLDCVRAAEAVFRDSYVNPSNGGIPAYWNFSHGLTEDSLRTEDAASRSAAISLAKNAAYAGDATPLAETAPAAYSREVAYTIMSYINAEKLGEPRRSRLALLVDQALGHIDQWFVSETAPYLRPFMVGLTAQALISYQEQIGDRDMVPVLEPALNELWERTWLPDSEAFMYTDRYHSTGGTEPAADLNLLIAPAYAWLYHKTGNDLYRRRADAIFAGGVRQAYLINAKQFNQSYRWSFAYLNWRNARPEK